MAKLYIDPSRTLVRYDPTPDNRQAQAAAELPSYMLKFIALAEPFVRDQLAVTGENGGNPAPLIVLLKNLQRARHKYEQYA